MNKNYIRIAGTFCLFSIFFLFSFNLFAQVGIGTTNPNPNALLDLDASTTPGGLLLPRVALSGTTSFAPMTANVEGMVVYNTATTSAGPNQVTPGYYFNDGLQWNRMATSSSSASNTDWTISGNSSTTPGTGAGENYLGTSDGEDLVIATDGSERVRVLNTGEIGIGASPDDSAALDISATDKGVSFPNISLASVSDATTIASPVPGLMVYNTNAALPCGTGLYFNNGTAAVPVWSCFTKTTQRYHSYNTASILVNNPNNGFFFLPGLSITFTVPAGQTVDVNINATLGSQINSLGSNLIGSFDTVFILDGLFVTVGGYKRTSIVKPGTTNNLGGYADVSLTTVWQNLGAGVHTIQLASAYASGTTAVIVGGDCAISAYCGEINAVVTYK